MGSATAAAHPNLAFVKYWGQRDEGLNLPANGSISANLSGATTTTTVAFEATLAEDSVAVNGVPAKASAAARVSQHLDRVRAMVGIATRARVDSCNDFPSDVGFASSASAFAALTLAATQAVGLSLSERELSIIARKGSGSACRSVPDGFVEWLPGEDDASSYAHSIAPCDHWDLRIVTVTPSAPPKLVSSLAGHRAATGSPFYAQRLRQVQTTLTEVRQALLARDFAAFSMVVEREALSLHAVAITSAVTAAPWMSGILYLDPVTVRLMRAVQLWRRGGLAVAFTLDAGPSVHLLCESPALPDVLSALALEMGDARYPVVVSRPGRGVWLPKTDGGTEAPPDVTCEQ